MKMVERLEQIPNTYLEIYIKENLRQTSPKTGKQILINVYKWSKEDLCDLIRGVKNCEQECIDLYNSRKEFEKIDSFIIYQGWDSHGNYIRDFEKPILKDLISEYDNKSKKVTLFPSSRFTETYVVVVNNHSYYSERDYHNIIRTKQENNKLYLYSCIGWG